MTCLFPSLLKLWLRPCIYISFNQSVLSISLSIYCFVCLYTVSICHSSVMSVYQLFCQSFVLSVISHSIVSIVLSFFFLSASVVLSICLSFYRSIVLFVCMSGFCLSISLSDFLSVCLSVLSVYRSASVCLSTNPSIHAYLPSIIYIHYLYTTLFLCFNQCVFCFLRCFFSSLLYR